MKLELRSIYLDKVANEPEDFCDFSMAVNIEVAETNRRRSAIFHFVFASPQRLQQEISEGEFQFMRGYILLAKFDWRAIHRSLESLIDRARSRKNWAEVIAFLSRHGVCDSEDIDGKRFPMGGAI